MTSHHLILNQSARKHHIHYTNICEYNIIAHYDLDFICSDYDAKGIDEYLHSLFSDKKQSKIIQ